MPLEIPLRSDLTHYDLQVVLEDVTYTLELRWNGRAGAWFMDLLDADGASVLQASMRAVVGYPINQWAADRQPPGYFVFIDTTFNDVDPGIGDLGKRVRLWYFTKAEVV